MSEELKKLQQENLAVECALITERAKVKELEKLIEQLKQQAIQHAHEARCANATLNEIYQAVSGAKGEKANWNGSRPVVDKIKGLEA